MTLTHRRIHQTARQRIEHYIVDIQSRVSNHFEGLSQIPVCIIPARLPVLPVKTYSNFQNMAQVVSPLLLTANLFTPSKNRRFPSEMSL